MFTGSGVLGALARRVDELYAQLDAEQQEAAEQLFLRLVTPGEGVVVGTEDLLKLATCRIRRGLTEEEIRRFNVPTPLQFDPNTRQCPPKLSWES